MKENQWISLLGLANRARKTISGEELTLKEIRNGKAKLILLSADASSNTTKKICDKCKSYGVPVKIVESRDILGHAIGKDARVVVAVLDTGFAKKMMTLLD
ncbi:YlxQ family RNA-binding protein [Bacillus benzoevorans]|uniref:Ribosomal protein L7Ae-like RNA K-turn-binding protein n=1 Tax=Bacillus benzoevorans TaxID=1456 RepID=A0A7X0HQF0_9BACI|nr:YlxQ family RNA-binding protein [Bacillus benzoevorans]MBB6443882.1 ribosomal protein L7Ae-like RNA K-turn-binding protein [Bacillus benzoevorans]